MNPTKVLHGESEGDPGESGESRRYPGVGGSFQALGINFQGRVNDSFSQPGVHQTRGPPCFLEKTGGPFFETRGPYFFKSGINF